MGGVVLLTSGGDTRIKESSIVLFSPFFFKPIKRTFKWLFVQYKRHIVENISHLFVLHESILRRPLSFFLFIIYVYNILICVDEIFFLFPFVFSLLVYHWKYLWKYWNMISYDSVSYCAQTRRNVTFTSWFIEITFLKNGMIIQI